MCIRSTSEWLPSGCLPLGQAQAWTWPQLGRQRAGAALPSPTPAADHHWAQMVGMTCGRISPAAATRRATGHRGWESGLGWGCYRQATANDVSKRRPNFHHQLPSTKAVPDVGNDKAFRGCRNLVLEQSTEATLRLDSGSSQAPRGLPLVAAPELRPSRQFGCILPSRKRPCISDSCDG